MFPALLSLVAIASVFPLHDLTADVSRALAPFAPPSAIAIIRQQLSRISEGQHGGLAAVGLLGWRWSGSSAMLSVIAATNKTYGVADGRLWWKVRLTAVMLTVAMSILIVITFPLMVAGPRPADALASHFAFGVTFVWAWKILQWPIVFGLVVIALGYVYYVALDAEQRWAWVTPGSLAATSVWIIASVLLRFYAVKVGSYELAYGAIGGVILLLLWFYLTGLAIVIGPEINAEIARASGGGAASR